MNKILPFLIEKLLQNAGGDVKSVKNLKNGTRLVLKTSREQFDKLIRDLPRNPHSGLS